MIAPARPLRDKRDVALDIAREALRQIARDRAAARPTAFFKAKAQFALDRIGQLQNAGPLVRLIEDRGAVK